MAMAMMVCAVVTSAWQPATASEPMQASKALVKLGRGATNTATGWVEVPKKIQETSKKSGAGLGWSWGLLRGLGHGFVRTAAGAYEVVTFPFPAPPGYESVIFPEYVFTDPTAPTARNVTAASSAWVKTGSSCSLPNSGCQ
jgi:putative exosortase-associated protein (TIGR04073 family)